MVHHPKVVAVADRTVLEADRNSAGDHQSCLVVDHHIVVVHKVVQAEHRNSVDRIVDCTLSYEQSSIRPGYYMKSGDDTAVQMGLIVPLKLCEYV